jgi:hypothetical protein
MVNFNNFLILDPEAADLSRELTGAFRNEQSDFWSFVNLWMGFNGWMECVTDANSDREMIDALANHLRLSSAYDVLMQNPNFRDQVEIFASMWPVLNVRDVRRKLGRDAHWRFSHLELMEEVIRQDVKREPLRWNDGNIPTWPQLLRTIYAVRCNLFHGSKSPQNYRDHELVVSCDRILRMFIEHTGCFEWND